MKGIVFLGERRLALVEVNDPTPGDGEVVVEIKASGMCGSDLHPYRAPQDLSRPPESRVIGGHEPSGIVAAVGRGVPRHVALVGDRVMVHHYHGCTVCRHCRTGWPQLCEPITRTTYSANAHGAHAPYMKVSADTLVPLHDSLSFEAGAAIACGTGTAWGGLERLQPRGDETIAVFGQGPVGLSATLLASTRGSRVIAIDLDDDRLAMARQFGADETINAREANVAEVLRELTGGQGVEMVVETSGSPQAAAAGLQAIAVWGKVCMVGIGGKVTVDTQAMLDRQITVMTSYTMSTVAQKSCADFVVSRNLDLDRLFTHRWRLDQAEDAYRVFDAQVSGKGAFIF
ncbi:MULTISPECIES: zinc-binding dehydrogenase [unclassified Mesorhizobium]|uniref:zinc-dependent alcohol dehydrogenase family protein n=1 Tax=unclassified Mesorhizobium TaxID=325217 RepID=UPI000FCC4F4E|nr:MULTISPECIES: zinc-binding dehydrogenase [unclassified Mesorhizobium]RUW78900.1 iditol 2-dehydrogenase [Mesorhizobium sp. M4B.F.Ca.ET.049.02.1.2]RVD30729.1 iditol 2-dehydrogenase [Mesorhizobium sp. M4B.F.Ca.ET.017.02.2.1]TGV26682.1 iditol 2-dehydrogenase [Mesorhizobium sp. M4B.F.Ca.ET.143.01.1.1]